MKDWKPERHKFLNMLLVCWVVVLLIGLSIILYTAINGDVCSAPQSKACLEWKWDYCFEATKNRDYCKSVVH